MGMYYWRVVRGDGNCYYRATMIGYIEKLITGFPDADKKLQHMVYWVWSNHPFYDFADMVYPEWKVYREKFCGNLAYLAEVFSRFGREKAQHLFLRMVVFDEVFDKAIIFYLRKMIAHFINKNNNFSLNGLPIQYAIEGGSLQAYVQNTVMNMGEDAQQFMFAITPLVLRIDVFTVFVDVKDKTNNAIYQEFMANTQDTVIRFAHDALNLHD